MSYKAWSVEEAGGEFHTIQLDHQPLEATQVLVRIAAAGLNPLDTKIRAGKAEHARQPLPAVLGLDMAGIVEDTGSAVTTFKPGDEVYGLVGGVGGLQGTLAQKIIVDADLLAHKPKALSMRQAAALPLSTITAWEGLVDHAKVHENQTILIHAGAGGVGHVAVQIAVAYGAKVFTTVSNDKRKIAEDFGAVPIDYRSSSVEEYVATSTKGKGFDIVYDTVGGATLDASLAAVKRYTGHALSCLGWGSHSLAPLSFRGATYSGVFTLLPLLTGDFRAHHGEILSMAAKLADEGKLKPLLSERTFAMEDLDGAFRLIEAGSLGKVTVEPL
ncbi:zinc-dependent alcohol dehydrogenase family protein [Edaphobacter dinghuensis]|uniref:Quinone oxidoreductase n=1 Tax=Edaphobacter dinghuensis TaxID=1560005 RepID=A0A917M2Q0_9BACT|nr:zinc-dependent alcohol dehydrogenase family protein [Edaphobacter dinghuensis]GGG71219.1 quinone oxidoreductase [Edaphobacter dinghuensis]